MPVHSRESPSQRYLDLLDAYQDMHTSGDPATGQEPEKTFDGVSLLPHVELIGALVRHYGAGTLLDYGAGKGMQYGRIPVNLPDGRRYNSIPEFWGVTVTCYDPGHEPFSQPPTGRKFDAVISTDVLEHCPEEDLEWIVGEMFDAAGKFLYANAANYPADKRLPTGENAHITIKPVEWWNALFEKVAATRDVPWLLSVEQRVMQDGKVKTQMTHLGTIKVS